MQRFFIAIILMAVVSLAYGQSENYKPSYVKKAVYFDKTPPLRDMPVVLPGERDRSWKDNIIKNPTLEFEMNEEQRLAMQDIVDPVAQERMGTATSRGPIYSFDGVGNVNGVYPPDTDGEPGPDHYFQMINLSFAIYDKQGNKLYGPVDNSTLWSGFIGPWSGHNDGDPIILYDEQADRWLASQFALNADGNTFWEMIAVSETGDPLGSYYRYAFEYDDFNDYPKIGVWRDGYYASFNMFGQDVFAAVSAYERDKMLVGDPDAQMVHFDMPGTWSMMPADADGPEAPEGAPCYFAHLKTWGNQDLEIWAFDVDWENPMNSTFLPVATLETDPFNSDVGGITQPNTGQRLSSISDRLMYRLQYRNFGDHESMVTNHTVKVSGHAAIRWYEMRKEGEGDWYMYQQGTYSPDSEHRWMGSIAMNGDGTIALGFSVSSDETYPSIRYTGRSADAPLGEMNYEEREIIAGTSSQTSINRWGDYSKMSVDPVDDTTFWYTTEYMGGGWKTRVGSFDFAPILPPQIEVGPDTTICETVPFLATATGVYVKHVQWETDGDGMFIPPNGTNMNQGYIRGPGDIENGGFQLNITAYGFDESMIAEDSIYVSISKLPEVNAGEDTLICYYNTLNLSGEISSYESFYWTSNGDGQFNDTVSLEATYTPGPEDFVKGYVDLTLNVIPLVPCEEEMVDDKVRIYVDACTGIDDPSNSGLNVQLLPNPSDGSFTMNIEGLDDEGFEVIIYDILGKVVWSKEGSKSSFIHESIDITNYPRGLYFVKVTTTCKSHIEKMLYR